jgi:hypothetical protein
MPGPSGLPGFPGERGLPGLPVSKKKPLNETNILKVLFLLRLL